MCFKQIHDLSEGTVEVRQWGNWIKKGCRYYRKNGCTILQVNIQQIVITIPQGSQLVLLGTKNMDWLFFTDLDNLKIWDLTRLETKIFWTLWKWEAEKFYSRSMDLWKNKGKRYEKRKIHGMKGGSLLWDWSEEWIQEFEITNGMISVDSTFGILILWKRVLCRIWMLVGSIYHESIRVLTGLDFKVFFRMNWYVSKRQRA